MRGPHTYLQIADDIQSRIRVGTYTHQLPSERALAQEYEVAYQTVRNSMRELRSRGLVLTRQGRGTFVNPDAPPEALKPPPDSDGG